MSPLSSRVTLIVGASLLMPALSGAATAASTAPSAETVEGEHLRIVSVADWHAATNLIPGDTVQWDLSISVDTSQVATVSIGLSAEGDAALLSSARLCLQQWDDDECPGGAVTVHEAWDLPRDDTVTLMIEITDTDTAHLRLMISLGDGAHVDDGHTIVRVHALTEHESLVVEPPGAMAPTGMSSNPLSLFIPGAAVLLITAAILFVAGRHGRDDYQRAGS